MALTLSQIGIETSQSIEAWHVSQTIDALTGQEAYDITISGSFTIQNGTEGTDLIAISDSNGQISFTNSITASLQGTSSYAKNALSSSYASTASYVKTAQTASYVLNTISSSYASTASYVLNAETADTASYVQTAQTASYVQTAQTASYVLNAVSSSYSNKASILQVTNNAFISGSRTGNTLDFYGSGNKIGEWREQVFGIGMYDAIDEDAWSENQNYAQRGLHVQGSVSSTSGYNQNIFFLSDWRRAQSGSGGFRITTDPDKVRFWTSPSGSETGSASMGNSDPHTFMSITCNNGTLGNTPNVEITNDLDVGGTLSKGAGSFKIPHPIESKKDTHYLVHSFIEGPKADNIYRGTVQLINGFIQINLDLESRMTEGTFVLLNNNTQCFTSNETSWDPVKGNIQGNILTINCQNPNSNDIISWLVIGERHDPFMINANWTDNEGKVIVEPEK